MAVYQFSALADGQAIAFNASADRLNFDQTTIAAGDLTLSTEGSAVRVLVKSGPQAGKDVLLTGFTLEQIAAINFSFADGSFARVGDNNVATVNDNGNNFVSGGTGRDLLMGLGGNDNLQAGDGNDSVIGGTGNDAVSGNNGNDWLTGGAGNDTLNGGGGQDAFVLNEIGAANADLLSDFSIGWDNVQLDAAAMTQIGAAGRFVAGDARFFAGAAAHDADDRIIYNSATQQILYDADGNGSGAAQLIATLGAGRSVGATDFWVFGEASDGGGNVINGTAGDDTLVGTAGPDTINGLGGNDSLSGGDGADSLSGGDGNDTLDGGPSRDPDDGSLETDIDTLNGGLGDDTYLVHGGTVVVADPGGIDWVFAERTDWTLGAGQDNLHVGATADFDNANGTGNELDNIIDGSGADHGGVYHGMGGNDTIFSAQRDGQIFGDDGDDVIDTRGGNNGVQAFGGNGNDTFIGGFGGTGNGVGTLTGGAGVDSFIFLGPANGGTITDFASGSEKIHLDATTMTALGASGNFAAGDGRFFAGAGATSGHDADDRVIFDTTTGNLWYDADGNGSGFAQLIVNVQSTVVATDIVVDNGTSGGGNTINGTSGNDSLLGGPGDDTINGFAGNDTIDGGGGTDSMVGGAGNDLYFVDEEADIIVELENEGIDEVRSSAISYTLPDFVNNLTLLGLAGQGIGNAIDNVITGSDTFSFLRGLGGNDTLIGGGVVSGETSDSYIGGTGNDSMVGSDADDTFYLVADTTSSYGQDTMVGGGARDDWGDRIFANTGEATTGINADLAAGTLTGGHAGSSVTLTGIESVWGTQFADRLVGNADMNQFDGGDGNDTLNGGAGFDRLSGGAGADWYVFSNTPGAANADNVVGFETGLDSILLDATVMTALGASGRFAPSDARFFAGAAAHDADDRVIWDGSSLWYDSDGTGSAAQQKITDLQTGTIVASDIIADNGSSSGAVINGTAGDDTLNGTFGPDTINGLGGNDSLHGSDGADSLNGGDGNDTLDAWDFGHGDGFADTLNGGLGNDVYQVHDDGDIIVADPGGIDTVRILNGDWALAGDLENLDLEDSVGAAFDGTGNALNNVIRGSSEGGTLQGLGGDDLLVARHVQNTAFLLGGDGNDTLDGGGWSTDMDGGAGNDLLIGSGGFGSDMIGGTGADTFAFASGNFNLIHDFASGTDKVQLDGSGFAGIGASGNFSAGDARFFAGTAAHDADDRVVFDGSTGNLYFDEDGNGSGEQTLVAVVTGNVVATDIAVINGTAPGGGTINGTPGNDSLTGTAGNDTINGNAGNDTLRGLGGDDSLDGGSGSDLLDGGLGNDFYVVTTGDTLTDAGGTDTVVALNSWALGSSFENLILATGAVDGSGNSGSNVIQGNAANNVLRARDGNDTVTGGGGSDFFDFTTAPSAGNADTITDFATVDQLRFEDGAFTAIGATGTWAATDGRFWAAAGATTGHDANDRLIYNTTSGALYYDADGSGAGAAVQVAILQGAPTLAASDITVI